jgi:hypothetical protein
MPSKILHCDKIATNLRAAEALLQRTHKTITIQSLVGKGAVPASAAPREGQFQSTGLRIIPRRKGSGAIDERKKVSLFVKALQSCKCGLLIIFAIDPPYSRHFCYSACCSCASAVRYSLNGKQWRYGSCWRGE